MNEIIITYENFWDKHSVNPAFLKDTLASTWAGQFPVPTEFVWSIDNQTPLIKTGRYWPYAIRDTEWFTLLEIWDEAGDDGHTSYQLTGYALMKHEEAMKYVENIARLDTRIRLKEVQR